MISVCLATFNGEEYIGQQLYSILKQIGPNDEVIVSDDGSTDRTVEIIGDFKDNRIKVIFNSRGKGCNLNFENAIINSIGDFIFLSDQDDVWMNGKVEKMMKRLFFVDFVVSDAQFADKDLNTIDVTFFSLRGGRKGFWNNLYKSRYLGACMAFRRTILKKLLPFPKNKELCPHDLWLTLISEFYYKVEVIDEPLILYRRHGQNVSDGGIKSRNSLFKKGWFRVYSLIFLIRRVNQ
jgi:glycosyltransferase involved in cell wall biosynthesis